MEKEKGKIKKAKKEEKNEKNKKKKEKRKKEGLRNAEGCHISLMV